MAEPDSATATPSGPDAADAAMDIARRSAAAMLADDRASAAAGIRLVAVTALGWHERVRTDRPMVAAPPERVPVG